MTLMSCAEGDELAPFGVDCGGCMTPRVYEAALGKKLRVPHRQPPRGRCGCLLTGDIGQYDTCGHLCRYCYANSSAEAVRRNRAMHDPHSPFLVGGARPDDLVHEARQEKWSDEQICLFKTGKRRPSGRLLRESGCYSTVTGMLTGVSLAKIM